MPFLVTARVESQMRFREYGAAIELRLNKAIAECGAIALEEIRSAETRRSDESAGSGFTRRKVSPGVHLQDSFQTTIRRVFRGPGAVSSVDVVVWTDNPNAIWQELGTRGRRRKT